MAAVSEFESIENDIKTLREWILKMPHIVQDHDDNAIRSLIIACKGSIQKTKEIYEKLNSLGLTFPRMFGHLDPLNETTQYYLNNSYFFLVPGKTDDGSMVVITGSKKTVIDSDKYSVLEMTRYIFMLFMVFLWENSLGDAKVIVVYDCQNSRLAELKNVTPTFLKEFISLKGSFPVRIQGVHNVNVPHFLQPIVAFVKSIVYKKLSDRIHFHSSMDELHEIIPKKLLPKEFGGDAGDLDSLHDLCKKKVESYRDRLISENNKMRKLDYLRPKSNKNGVLEGSFRKLEVD